MLSKRGNNDMPARWYEQSVYNRKVYDLYKEMWRKCKPTYKQQQLVNYKGVTVCERWNNLSNFVEDLPNVPGYDEWVKWVEDPEFNPRMHFVTQKKVYSPDSVIFTTHSMKRKWLLEE